MEEKKIFNTIKIDDDFDLDKISLSGQCFRVKKLDDSYRFICQDHVLYIRPRESNSYEVTCEMDEWRRIWMPYFDLGCCYQNICDTEKGKNDFIDQAMDFGRGIRILRQDPWEMLLTFILSQRKNIPAISQSVEMLAENYGHCIRTEYETLHTFPNPKEMAKATEEELRDCGVGYRAAYLLDAIQKVITDELNLEQLAGYQDEELLHELQKVKGVGEKVANCIALFAYHRMDCVPVDVWIVRAIQNDCSGESPFCLYEGNAGIMQQYVYYYEKYR